MSGFGPDPYNRCSSPLREELSHPEQPQDPGDTRLSGIQRVIIIAIRVTDLTLGLRQIPAGFHVTVQADGAEWQTTNKPIHVVEDVVVWDEHVLLPSEPSSKVRVNVYASFELVPMLSHGELLRTFDISVGELLDRSEKSQPILFQPKAGEVVSPCTSLFMTVEQRRSDEYEAAILRPLDTLTSSDVRARILVKTDAGHRLLARYHRTQNNRDLDQSIKHFERASDLCPVDHPCRPATSSNLATTKFISFQVNGTYLDLDIPISLFDEALDMRPTGHPDRPLTQLHLAIALLSRFAKRGFQADADAAKELLNEVRNVCLANSHLYKAALLAIETSASGRSTDANTLQAEGPIASMLPYSTDELDTIARRMLNEGNCCLAWVHSLHTRFMRRGNSHDLNEAIASHKEALGFNSVGHQYRSMSLNGLAVALSTRFNHQRNDEDLDEAIVLNSEALALHPVGHPNRSTSLNNSATALSTRFQHRGDDQDLDEAIIFHREALALRPVGHPDRTEGNAQDLDEAIPLHREALALFSVGHPDRSTSLNNFATVLSTRFKHRGDDQDLDEAIVLHNEALDLCPVGHPDRSWILSNFSSVLSTRFEHRGNYQDLDDAIVHCREAVALCPIGHRDRVTSLINLANRLYNRFEHQGNERDLDEAISLHRKTLTLSPVGHQDRTVSLDNLAIQLRMRSKHRGDDQDLNEAIALHREALALFSVGHTDRYKTLGNLAGGLYDRFLCQCNNQDLDEAIALLREAMTLRPVGHPDRSLLLDELANRLNSRSSGQDWDEAMLLHREIMSFPTVRHADRSMALNNHGIRLYTHFEHQNNAKDLNESLESLHRALTLLTQHDPRQLTVHRSLASAYLIIHSSGLDGTDKDADTNVVSGGLLLRLQASLYWVLRAVEYAHDTELEAYETSIQLLDVFMSATASVSSRHHNMMEFPSTLAVDAASCALRRGDVCHAVELLEQGRTLIWTQMARLRTPLDSLQERGPHAQALMKKFRGLSLLLDRPPAYHSEGTSGVGTEAAATRYRHLMGSWNATVENIRKIDDFGRFLLPPLFSELQDAARNGPIIVLVASKSSCDAIIIPHQEPPVSVGLAINAEKLVRLVHTLQRAVESEAQKQAKLVKVLRELWVKVVHPVVENLARVAKPGSRIWWCPTSFFNFLPLHAAGEYRPGGKFLSQLYVSSYTPSLTALIKARRSHDRSLSVSFAAIGQNHPPEHSFALKFVEPELDLVQSLLPPSPTVSFTKVTSVESTKSTALRTLRANHWIHFACHATQNLAEPFKSAFLMRDQPLQLLDISHMDLSRHEFAFLSACETAVGDFGTPDEAIHLAAGLQFSGVKSVIGTFWNVNDITVQRLVMEFYKNFCGDGKMNSKRAARALHRAVQSLAGDKAVPLDQRIVFMHIGL
ncbi:CHAT domain-containing protein [Suillus paluster]|uniref:CHAT domain-containing protein n=1 Tax=Suillus paluster TaxID=48578 RepID=UPI001B875671|nr:CHAT domain-containing protein [Suillus paluster]KAG1721771.1 CHAT domain-containing protein [Suillus paluster]